MDNIKKKIIFLGFILFGILFSYLLKNPLIFIAMGATGKVIVGHYTLPEVTSYGKVICGRTTRNQYNPNIIIS